MSNRARSLEELIRAVGENPKQVFTGAWIVDAYEAGKITAGEAKQLQTLSRLSPAKQKRRLKNAREVTAADIDKMRATLNDAMDRFYAQNPERKDPRSE